MRILIPILGFGNAGGYKVLSLLANELIDLGHDVEFLSTDASKSPYYKTFAKIYWANEKGGRNTSNMPRYEGFISTQIKLIKSLNKINKDEYDIILANHSLTVLPLILTGWKNKAVYYIQAYEPEMYKIMGGLKNKILALISKWTYSQNLFSVVNASIYCNYKNIKSTRILYPGIDFNYFYPKTNSDKKENIIIGTIGRSEKYKGTEYIINAIVEIKKKYSNVNFFVAFGDPKDFEDYDWIRCFNPNGYQELGDFYRSLDYYFCAGYIQLGAFHYPVAEAMSCGVPIITTQYYPANDKNSFLVRIKNVKDFVDQFEIVINHPETVMNIKEQAKLDVEQFNWKIVGEKMNAYLNEFKSKKI